jgi:hypothetical protein
MIFYRFYTVSGSSTPRNNIFLGINYFIPIIYCSYRDSIVEINLSKK